MTNDEAIKEIQRWLDGCPFEDTKKAFDLAIKALEFTESQRICCDNCVNHNIKSKEVCTSPFGECEFFNCGADMEGGAE